MELSWGFLLYASLALPFESDPAPNLGIYIGAGNFDDSRGFALNMLPRSLRQLNDAVKLHGDDEKHEKTDAWCNRDLVPMPPSRRTWGLVEYYGYWSLTSLNVSFFLSFAFT